MRPFFVSRLFPALLAGFLLFVLCAVSSAEVLKIVVHDDLQYFGGRNGAEDEQQESGQKGGKKPRNEKRSHRLGSGCASCASLAATVRLSASAAALVGSKCKARSMFSAAASGLLSRKSSLANTKSGSGN